MKQLNRDFVEESVLLASTLKWILLSSFAGIVAGGTTSLFLNLLSYGIKITSSWSSYYLFLPFALFISSWLVIKFAPEAEGHGTEKVIESVHKRNGKINLKVIPIKTLATIITLSFGGSAGKEGPSAQIGAGTASFFANLLKLNQDDYRRFVICGISAGFAGVFGTPIAGAIFAAEVLYVGRFSYRVLLPALFASYISFFINRYFGISHFRYSIDVGSQNDFHMFIYMVVFGIVVGIVALFFIKTLTFFENLFKEKVQIYKPLKGFIGGIILIFVVWVTKSTDYLGLGTDVIDRAIHGDELTGLSFLGKIFTTSITLSTGGSGGILTPVFFIGSTLGNVWAQLVGGNIAMYSGIGMVALLAASANTPLAAITMSMELFGVQTATYASIASVVSYLIVGHHSVYPSQILTFSKTPSIHCDINCELRQIHELKLSNKPHLFLKFFRNDH
ncbi:chloride channel protein [Tepidibacillus fermentans]|uniref:H+/Cl-antiporter ClcA n=1 Tax=Tepidibacillus fermentans TaxID=1281767 RepID=A0A4R3K6P6_9BACI|nr:chloride channel protein [Tepidibacillus fermentans]TCS78467.1 H+/Cl- antiporter ClcA [Tepidibacillus fermentans]